MQGICEQIRIVFSSCFLIIISSFIYTECYCMIFFCINMYLKMYLHLCMPYAYIMQFCYLAFFSICPPNMICTISTTHALCFSPWCLFFFFFFIILPPGLPVLPTNPRHNDAQTIREIYRTYPMTTVPGRGGL